MYCLTHLSSTSSFFITKIDLKTKKNLSNHFHCLSVCLKLDLEFAQQHWHRLRNSKRINKDSNFTDDASFLSNQRWPLKSIKNNNFSFDNKTKRQWAFCVNIFPRQKNHVSLMVSIETEFSLTFSHRWLWSLQDVSSQGKDDPTYRMIGSLNLLFWPKLFSYFCTNTSSHQRAEGLKKSE